MHLNPASSARSRRRLAATSADTGKLFLSQTWDLDPTAYRYPSGEYAALYRLSLQRARPGKISGATWH